MESKDVILFVYDTPNNFEESKSHIGRKGITYKDIINFNSLEIFNKELNSSEISNSDLILVVIHVFSETLNGVREFQVSGIQESYPFMHYKYITNKGTINEMCKRAIDDDLPLCKKDVFKYHEIREYIKNSSHAIPTKGKLLTTILENKIEPFKNGIFLSHSSRDLQIVEKFRDLILITALGCELDNILFTSDESTAVQEGVNIPLHIEHFIKHRSGLFIQFISDNYIKSRVCINEEGAGWVLSKNNYITFLLPNYSSNDVTWLKTVEKASNINNKDSLFNIYDNRKHFFKNVNTPHLNKKIDEFLKWVNENYPISK